MQPYVTQETETDHAIRSFLHPHPQADQLPSVPKSLPILIFVHGLGGVLALFHPLPKGLVNLPSCLDIHFPGCGQSDVEPKSWKSYTLAALAALLEYGSFAGPISLYHQSIVLVRHRVGCSLLLLVHLQQATLGT